MKCAANSPHAINRGRYGSAQMQGRLYLYSETNMRIMSKTSKTALALAMLAAPMSASLYAQEQQELPAQLWSRACRLLT